MRRLIKIMFLIFIYLFTINCYASTDAFLRTNDNLRVPSDVKVDESNIADIMNTISVSSSEKVYDFANILSDSEEKKLYNSISEYTKETGYDAVILTTSSLSGYSVSDYAYNFYDYNDFLDDGVIFIIYANGNNKEIFMGNSGKTGSEIFSIYNDSMIKSTLKYLYENSISSGNYYNGCNDFIKIIKGFYYKNSTNYKVDEKGNIVKTIPMFEVIILSIALTFIIIILAISRYRDKKVVLIDNKKYIDNSTMSIKLNYDNLIDTVLK